MYRQGPDSHFEISGYSRLARSRLRESTVLSFYIAFHFIHSVGFLAYQTPPQKESVLKGTEDLLRRSIW